MVSPKVVFWSRAEKSSACWLGEYCSPVSPGAHAVPVDPEQSLPRSFPGGPAAVGDAAFIFEGLMLAAGDEYISSVSTEGRAQFFQCSRAGGFIE